MTLPCGLAFLVGVKEPVAAARHVRRFVYIMPVCGLAVLLVRELLDVRIEAGLSLAQQVGGGWLPIGVTVGLALAVAVVALLLRRRLPVGLGEGAFVAAVSGGLILALPAVDSAGEYTQRGLVHVLTGLTVVWYVLARVALRGRTLGSQPHGAVEADHLGNGRAQVWAWAALVCGLGVLGAGLVAGAVLWKKPPVVGAEISVLLLLAVVIRIFVAGSWTAYPGVTVVACLFVVTFPIDHLSPRSIAWSWGMNLVGLLSLAAVVWAVLARWWRRRQRWLEDSQRPVELPPAHGALFGALVGLSVLVGLAGLLQRDGAFTPSAVVIAALTCLTIGHVRGWLVASEIGLVLIGESIVTASLGWLRPGWSGALLGLGLASGYLLWLARFWDQQLNAGEAWTTAGRLIPVARRLSYVAAAGALAATAGAVGGGDYLVQPVWLAGVALLCLLGGMLLFVRDGCEHQRIASALAACLVMVAAVGPGCRLLLALVGSAVSPVVALAAGAALLASAVAGRGRVRLAAVAYNAFIGGVLPVIVLFALAWRGFDAQSAVALGLTAVAVFVGFMGYRADTQPVQAEDARCP